MGGPGGGGGAAPPAPPPPAPGGAGGAPAGGPARGGGGPPPPPGAGPPPPPAAGGRAGAAAGLPSAASAFGLPSVAQVGLPEPAQSLPMTADVLPPMRSATAGDVVGAAELYDESFSLDEPRAGSAFTRRAPRQVPDAIDVGGEIALGDDSSSLSAGFGEEPGPAAGAGKAVSLGPSSMELDPAAAAAAQRPAATDVGGEVELGADQSAADLAPVSRAGPKAPVIEIAQKKSRTSLYVLAGIVVAAIGGGSLSLFPEIGPFGWNVISDKINAGNQAASLEGLRKTVQEHLGSDTSADAGRALQAARASRDAAPRHRPTSAYAAYVAFARGLRFGRKSDDDAYAKQLLAAIKEPSDELALANAALDAGSGQLARARQSVAVLAAKRPKDADIAALAGEIELASKAPDKAVAAWKKAVEIQKNARTLFGLARAQLAAGDTANAEANAKAAIEASPKHSGARTLLASIAWQSPGREQEALGLLAKVTDEGEVRESASPNERVDAYTLVGRIHLGRSRMSAAEAAFGEAIKLDPQAVQALVGSGELFYRSGRFSEGLARYEAAIRADADSIPGKVGMAKTWIALERMKESKDLLKKLRDANPKDPLVAYWLGRAEDALGNKKDAEAAYLDAIKIGENKPEVVDAYVSLSYLLSARGRPEEAAAKLAEATGKFPDSPALHKAKGEVFLQTGRYEDAKKELEDALAAEDDLGTKFKLGVAYRRMRSFEEATKIFDGVAIIDKEYPGLALERGLLFEETSQSERALEMYNDALRKAPNDVDLKLRVGSTQVMAGHAKQAEPILRAVLKDRPNSAEANHFLGRALLVKGTNLAEAMRFLERATDIDPNRAEYHLYVGWGANEAGQPTKAADALKRALELDHDLGDAYWQRGVLLQRQGATLDALADLKIALEKRPSRYQAYATMAMCYGDQSKWAEAEEAWRKAIAADDGVAEWHYRLGKIYYNRQNRPGATAELDKAVTIGELPETSPAPTWLFDAHFLLGEMYKAAGNKEKAVLHYEAFLRTAPSDNAYRPDAEKALKALKPGER